SASPTRVLLVEQDTTIAVGLARALTRAGFETITVPTGAQALATARRIAPDIVLIENTQPNCRIVYHRLKRDCGAAVVVLADSDATADRDEALDGADDYVVKPISDRITIARIRAVLRRSQTAGSDAIVAHGPLLLNPITRRASLDGRDLRLTRREFELLERLVRDAGTVLTREQLMREVWRRGTGNGSSTTLSTHIGQLRRKLGDDAAQPRFIHTVRGVGFRFATVPEMTQ
ncbi:MAG TPA: response regulator transcription factor, partial [Conexibacter sp.]|nr:response regulator transcription factor [Conexibacter sp.]